jgi:hypothetical protein
MSKKIVSVTCDSPKIHRMNSRGDVVADFSGDGIRPTVELYLSRREIKHSNFNLRPGSFIIVSPNEIYKVIELHFREDRRPYHAICTCQLIA